VPAGEPHLTISFYLKVQGEGCCDYLDIFIAPTSVTPTPGAQVDGIYRVARYNLQSNNWVFRTVQACAYYTGTVRVIFSW